MGKDGPCCCWDGQCHSGGADGMLFTVGMTSSRGESGELGFCPGQGESTANPSLGVFQPFNQGNMEGEPSFIGEDDDQRVAANLSSDLGKGIDYMGVLPGGEAVISGEMQANGGAYASDSSSPCAMQCEAKEGWEADGMKLEARGVCEDP